MKKAFLFSGQGSQFAGMGSNYYHTFSDFRNIIEELSDFTSLDIKSLILDRESEKIHEIQYAQIAIFAVSLGIFSIIQKEIGNPDVYAGHSFGEITAYTASQVFDYQIGSKIVLKRGELMEKVSLSLNEKGSMLVIIGIKKDIIKGICQEVSKKLSPVYISALNSSNQIVISGYQKALNFIQENIHQYQAKAININVSGPFHCPIFQEARNQFKEFLKSIPIKEPKAPVFTTLTGKKAEFVNIKNYIADNLTKPILWNQVVSNLMKSQTKFFIEIGPKNILQNIINSIILKKEDFKILGTETPESLEKTIHELK